MDESFAESLLKLLSGLPIKQVQDISRGAYVKIEIPLSTGEVLYVFPVSDFEHVNICYASDEELLYLIDTSDVSEEFYGMVGDLADE